MTRIIVAAGLCSAIRPKLLTALPPERYPNIKITAWGEGHWHIPCPDSQVFPDADIWVKKHIAHVDVRGDESFAKWVEYVICRLMSAQPGTMHLMSSPLEPRNAKWAAKWDTLPAPGDWKQAGCKNKPPKQDGKTAQSQPRPKRRASRQPASKIFSLAGILRVRRPKRQGGVR